MNDKELKDLWRTQKVEAAPFVAGQAQIQSMRNKMADVHTTLKARNSRELGVGVVLIIIFGIYYFVFPYPLTRVGSLVIIAGVLFSSWKMMNADKEAPRPDPGAPVAQWLRLERQRIQHEAELLRTVFWWYIFPIGLGTNLFFWGLPNVSSMVKTVFTALAMAMYGWIYWLNQSARENRLLPVVDELETLLQQEPLGEGMQTNTTANAQRKKHLNAWWIIFALLLATYCVITAVWQTFDRPRDKPIVQAPPFKDISAFETNEVAQVDSWLEEQMALAKYPSLSVAVVQDDKIVYQRALGFENIKAGRKASPETSYHVASVTKAFTASLAVLLHARGVFDLDEPAIKYLPSGVSISSDPKVGATITLRQLASHTSGLPRGVPGAVQSVEDRYELEPQRLYKHLGRIKLEYEPGTSELYSNLGFGLLGHVLERAAGKPFNQLTREMLCNPLQLQDTAVEGNYQTLRVATGYGNSFNVQEEKHSLKNRLAGSGGLVATANDLVKFMSAQMKPGYFSAEMLQELYTPTKLINGRNSYHSLGWTVQTGGAAGLILHKNGGRNNCSAWIGFAPEKKVAVAIVSNIGGAEVERLGAWLLERFLGSSGKPMRNEDDSKVPP